MVSDLLTKKLTFDISYKFTLSVRFTPSVIVAKVYNNKQVSITSMNKTSLVNLAMLTIYLIYCLVVFNFFRVDQRNLELDSVLASTAKIELVYT